jgi:signal transduction histidine kinase/ligand-binding sensor domain-containing protein
MAAFALGVVLLGSQSFFALNPSLGLSQYTHTSWTQRDSFSVGNIFAIAQTADGYLWLGGDFGLFRFDGVNAVRWEPPGQRPPERFVFRLLGARDGSLWIGTFESLSTWNGSTLTRHPEFEKRTVGSLLEDREGTVWAGTWNAGTPPARLCAMRGGSTQCYGDDGKFGKTVAALYEDSSGSLWAFDETGLWRWNKSDPTRVATLPLNVSGISTAENGQTIVAVYGGSVLQTAGEKLEPYSIRSPGNSNQFLGEHQVDANKLLRDRDGGLWIGTVERGLIHLHQGRTDVFTKKDGLSGDVILSLFEDREGNVWVSTIGGIDRFGEPPVTNLTTAQGLASDAINSVLAAKDGSVWIATHDGVTRWKNGQTNTFREESGLPDISAQSLFQDDSGRIWVSTHRGLAYSDGRRFTPVKARLPSDEVYSVTGDQAGNLWLSGNKGLSHLIGTRLVETFPWSTLGRKEQAKVLVADKGGIWLSFWNDGGVEYFKDGRVQASYAASDGLGLGHVPGLRLDSDGALWASTQDGGLSRIKDGHVTTLTTRNGLPCDNVHWSAPGDDGSTWLYTVCGLVRITRSQLDAWIANPNQRIETTLWGASDGVRLGVVAPSSFGPTVAKSNDGRLWFLVGEGLSIVDPRHVVSNSVPPPVHIERVVADRKTYWQNLPGMAVSSLRLPAWTRDVQIYYTALSLVASRKVHFKYKLEGQDPEWREVVDDRDVQYSNLSPARYRFRVIACNNSEIWNEQGDTLEFSIDPAYYQTTWFRALCTVVLFALVWAIYRYRVRQLRHEFALTLDARVAERTSIARELHDTLLQSFHGLMLRFQIVSQLLPERPVEAKEQLDSTIDRAAKAITEGRDAVQGLRESTVQTNDLARAITTLGQELANDPGNHGSPAFRVTVEGVPRDLHPILRDETYRILAEALRNAFHHAAATHIEVEIRYDPQQLRLRVRDDGKGVDPSVLSRQDREGHYGLPGMQERATLIGGKLEVWSEIGTGTEVELSIPAAKAYTTVRKDSRTAQKLAGKA